MKSTRNSPKSVSRSQHNMTTGRMFVEKPDVLEEMVVDCENHTDSTFRQMRNDRKLKAKTIGLGTAVKSNETHTKLLKEQQRQLNIQTEATTKKNVQKSLDIAYERQERMFPILLSNVDQATAFLDVVDREISLHDETQKNKTRRQYEDWNTTVHGAIQKNIAKSVNSMNSKVLNKKKNADYEKFLSITNRKPAIFRDIIIESEYDPLEPNRNSIKARTGFLKDPVKIDAQKAEAERSMLGSGGVGPRAKQKQKLGKDTLPVELWASGQIEATPYGTFARIMNKNKGHMSDAGGINNGKNNATMKSSITFDHFDFPVGKAAVNLEMPRGKRIHPINNHADPSKTLGHLPIAVKKEIDMIEPPENCAYVD